MRTFLVFASGCAVGVVFTISEVVSGNLVIDRRNDGTVSVDYRGKKRPVDLNGGDINASSNFN